jgi:hypothetical protein
VATILILIAAATTTQRLPLGALMFIPASASKRIGKLRCDTCNGRFGLLRQRLGQKQFCCKACRDNYFGGTTRAAYRSRRWLEFLARKE